MAPVTRRQFLAALGLGSVGAAAVAVAAALRPGGGAGDPPPAAAPTTSRPAMAGSSTSRPPPAATTGSAATPTTTAPASTPTTAAPTTSGARGAVAAGIVEVIGRDAWGASPPRGSLPAHTIERITVHHTASFLGDNTQAPGRWRSYQQFHQDAGFVDIAYHVLIDAAGNVYAGRDPAIPGETFTDYDPTGHFLPVLDGNFDEQPVPPAQLAALADVVAWAVTEYGAGVGTIAGHRDYVATACPGASLYPLVADGTLARQVEARLAAGGIELVALPPDVGVARVGAIEAG